MIEAVGGVLAGVEEGAETSTSSSSLSIVSLLKPVISAADLFLAVETVMEA